MVEPSLGTRRSTRRGAKLPKVMTCCIRTPCLPPARRELRLLPPDGGDTELPLQPLGPPHSVPPFFFFFLLASLPSLALALFTFSCHCCCRCFRGTACNDLASYFFPGFLLGVSPPSPLAPKKWCIRWGIITFGGPACLLSPLLGLYLCASFAVYTLCPPTSGACVHVSVWRCLCGELAFNIAAVMSNLLCGVSEDCACVQELQDWKREKISLCAC